MVQSSPLHLLYAERRAADAAPPLAQLRLHAAHIQVQLVHTAPEVLTHLQPGLQQSNINALLLDLRIADELSQGLALVAALRGDFGLDLPIIVVADPDDEDAAVEALRQGATDYIIRQGDALHRLPFALESAHLRVLLERERSALLESETRLRQLAETIDDVFYLVEPTRQQMLYVSPAIERVWGIAPNELMADSLVWLRRVHPDDKDRVAVAMRQQSPEEHYDVEFRFDKGCGIWRHVRMRGYPVADGSGRMLRRAGVVHDITSHKQQEERIQHLAYHDALTGLPNRTLVLDRLARGLAHAQRTGGMLAVLFLDLDRFKTINDTLGHLAGDQLLCEVASRLRQHLREEDTVARLGGDEFLVVLEDIQDIAQVAHVAEKLIAALGGVFSLADQVLHITTSLGISVCPRDGEDALSLLKYADTALYKAKASGRDTYRFFSPDMDVQAHARLSMERDLRHALARQELELHYQPQIELTSGKLCAIEALLRWRHPTRGLLWPSEFIPLAEEVGLMGPMGQWVLNQACAQMQQWRRSHAPDLRIAVNLSPRHLRDGDIVNQVTQALASTGLPAAALTLEITEASLMCEPEQALSLLGSLRALGVEVSIDDFGTGYSSLACLKRFPIQRLKVDGSFIDGIGQDPGAEAIIEAVTALAHKLGLQVLAESVETAAQREFLNRLGCDEAQGHLFGCPQTASATARSLWSQVTKTAAETCSQQRDSTSRQA